MPTIYKIDYPNTDKPIAQEVEKVGYPNLDADGETQYENTHFEDLGKAWDALVLELDAGVKFSTKDVISAQDSLTKSQKRLSEYAILLFNAKEGREKFLLKKLEKK